jgi:hypothetical protein
MNSDSVKLVTKRGESFDAAFQRKQVAHDRDGVLYLFHLTDCKNNRGKRLVSLFRSGPAKLGIQDYDARVETVRLNALRRAFDSAALTFDGAYEEDRYKEVRLDTSDFNIQPPATQEQIKQYIKHKAYWLGFKYNEKPGVYSVQFDNPIDLEYLGVDAADVRRYVWLLGEQGFLKDIRLPGTGRPTNKLVEEYESVQPTKVHNVLQTGDEWDVFVSHASEDKEAIAGPLAEALRSHGLRVWYDDFTLRLGDSLRESIDRGLARSRFGIVILSAHFFEKRWPQKELNGLATREADGEKVILPVWHEIGFVEVRGYSPTLADLKAVETKDGLPNVVERILEVVNHVTSHPPRHHGVVEPRGDPFTEDLAQHVRQVVGYTMTLNGQLLLRWLLIQGRIECTQQFMPEIPLDVQHKQMEIAVKAGIVHHETERGGLMRTFCVVNPEIKPVLKRVLPELLTEAQRPHG